MTDNVDAQEGAPDFKSTFREAVGKVRMGQAETLPIFDIDEILSDLGNLDQGLIDTFFEKTRSFLRNVISTAGRLELSEEEKVQHLNNIYNAEISPDKPGGSDYRTTPVNLQIMKLGALAFVGESRNQNAEDPKHVETETVTQLHRGIGTLNLNDYERQLVSALAAGTEIGFGDIAGVKFGEICNNIRSKTENRSQVPEEDAGVDFIEGLLATKI